MAALADAALAVEGLDLEPVTRRSTAITRAVVRITAPTADAARWRISTSVPTVIQPGSR